MKKLSLFLALLMLGLTACGSTDPGPSDTSDTPSSDSGETTPADTEPAFTFTEDNYNGYEFRIIRDHLGYSCYNFEYQDADEQNGDLLNDAVYKRNLSAEEKYNIKISEIDTGDLAGTVTRSIQADDNEFDVAMPRSDALGRMFQAGMYMDFHEIPNLNLDQPWWDQNMQEICTINGKLLFMSSDISIMHYETSVINFFNKKLAEDYKLGDLYQLVRDGKWTMDTYSELTKNIRNDLNGDSRYDENDLYPLTGWYDVTMPQFYIGGGANYVEKDADGELIYAVGTEQFERVFSKVSSVLSGSARVTDASFNPENLAMFISDHTFIFSGCVGEAKEFRDMPNDFGVLPAPKLDENQETYLTYSNCPIIMLIPVTAEDPARTGAILEWLSYRGHEEVIPSFYETMILTKYLRDDESVEMLDVYCMPNRIYHYGDIFNIEANVINQMGVADVTSQALMSTAASYKATATARIEAFCEVFE